MEKALAATLPSAQGSDLDAATNNVTDSVTKVLKQAQAVVAGQPTSTLAPKAAELQAAALALEAMLLRVGLLTLTHQSPGKLPLTSGQLNSSEPIFDCLLVSPLSPQDNSAPDRFLVALDVALTTTKVAPGAAGDQLSELLHAGRELGRVSGALAAAAPSNEATELLIPEVRPLT